MERIGSYTFEKKISILSKTERGLDSTRYSWESTRQDFNPTDRQQYKQVVCTEGTPELKIP